MNFQFYMFFLEIEVIILVPLQSGIFLCSKGKNIAWYNGSIAAYKSAVLVRLLVKARAEVKVVMTPAACKFPVGPLTLSTFSKPGTHGTVPKRFPGPIT